MTRVNISNTAAMGKAHFMVGKIAELIGYTVNNSSISSETTDNRTPNEKVVVVQVAGRYGEQLSRGQWSVTFQRVKSQPNDADEWQPESLEALMNDGHGPIIHQEQWQSMFGKLFEDLKFLEFEKQGKILAIAKISYEKYGYGIILYESGLVVRICFAWKNFLAWEPREALVTHGNLRLQFQFDDFSNSWELNTPSPNSPYTIIWLGLKSWLPEILAANCLNADRMNLLKTGEISVSAFFQLLYDLVFIDDQHLKSVGQTIGLPIGGWKLCDFVAAYELWANMLQ